MNKDTFKKELNCKLTEEEVVEYGSQLARLTTEAQELRETKKNIASEYNNRISSKESMARVLAKRVATGEEMREVECHYVYDWKAGERTAFRDDTMDELDTDVIPEHEKQQKLDLKDRDDDGVAGDPELDENTTTTEAIERDELFDDAVVFAHEQVKTTVSGLRNKLHIGGSRAKRIFEQMVVQNLIDKDGAYTGYSEPVDPEPVDPEPVTDHDTPNEEDLPF